jgi:hypothetical protein
MSVIVRESDNVYVLSKGAVEEVNFTLHLFLYVCTHTWVSPFFFRLAQTVAVCTAELVYDSQHQTSVSQPFSVERKVR